MGYILLFIIVSHYFYFFSSNQHLLLYFMEVMILIAVSLAKIFKSTKFVHYNQISYSCGKLFLHSKFCMHSYQTSVQYQLHRRHSPSYYSCRAFQLQYNWVISGTFITGLLSHLLHALLYLNLSPSMTLAQHRVLVYSQSFKSVPTIVRSLPKAIKKRKGR